MAVALIVMVVGWAIRGRAELPFWICNTETGSALEQAFFRTMAMPYGSVFVSQATLGDAPRAWGINSQATEQQRIVFVARVGG